jgi:hypothetical protein
MGTKQGSGLFPICPLSGAYKNYAIGPSFSLRIAYDSTNTIDRQHGSKSRIRDQEQLEKENFILEDRKIALF